jgi:ATP-dependent helicase/nuclease subunit A
MIRRIQNRGYSTLARIASHVDRLYAGDESNAAIEAIDAVNLMTAHAAKGLEFPIVFVVSLTKAAGGMAPAVRVVLDDDEGERVWVGPFASDDDRNGEKEREAEETKRLLYVALTRARDRLYLGTVLKDGKASAGNGSLAKVLPKDFLPMFERAGREEPDVAWTIGARTYPFRVCPRPGPVPLTRPRVAPADAPPADFTALTIAADSPASAVTSWGGAADRATGDPAEGVASLSDRLVGTLVHRMLQTAGESGRGRDAEDVALLARALLLDEEVAALDDVDAAVRQAAAAFRALAARDDVRTLLGSGECLYEVPFSFRQGGRTLRGTIDCLVSRAPAPGAPPADVTVVEFKTGRKRPEHQAQLDAYVAAARALFPGADVSGRLIYA